MTEIAKMVCTLCGSRTTAANAHHRDRCRLAEPWERDFYKAHRRWPTAANRQAHLDGKPMYQYKPRR